MICVYKFVLQLTFWWKGGRGNSKAAWNAKGGNGSAEAATTATSGSGNETVY